MKLTHLSGFLLAATCFALNGPAAGHGEHTNQLKPDRVLLTLNGDPATQIAVTWRTDAATTGVAQYAEAIDGPALEKDARISTATVAEVVETTPGQVAYYQSATLSGLK